MSRRRRQTQAHYLSPDAKHVPWQEAWPACQSSSRRGIGRRRARYWPLTPDPLEVDCEKCQAWLARRVERALMLAE